MLFGVQKRQVENLNVKVEGHGLGRETLIPLGRMSAES